LPFLIFLACLLLSVRWLVRISSCEVMTVLKSIPKRLSREFTSTMAGVLFYIIIWMGISNAKFAYCRIST